MTKVLIHANHYPVASARYMTDAFKRLGCEVYHDGQPMGRHIWGLTLPPEYEWTPDPPPEDWTPDIIVVMDSDPAVLDARYEYTTYYPETPMVVYGVDNHVRDYRRPFFDHYFLAHRYASLMEWTHEPFTAGELAPVETVGKVSKVLVSKGGVQKPRPDMTWLPCAYDAMYFTPSPIPYQRRKYDVALLGVMYPERLELVNALQKAGLSVIWGTGLVYDAYKDAHHEARVSLCHNVAGDLNQRVFECGAMRTAVVIMPSCHDLTNPDTNAQLKLDGFVLAHTVEDAVSVCKELAQDNPTLGEHGADRMMRSCIPHTWDARGRAILDWLAGQPVTIATAPVDKSGLVEVRGE